MTTLPTLIINLIYLVPTNSLPVVITDSPVLGTGTNPIAIEEDYTPLGSAYNPIMIYIKEDYNRSGFTILVLTKIPIYEDLEKSQAPRQLYINHTPSNYRSTSYRDRKDRSERVS